MWDVRVDVPAESHVGVGGSTSLFVEMTARLTATNVWQSVGMSTWNVMENVPAKLVFVQRFTSQCVAWMGRPTPTPARPIVQIQT